MLLVIISLCQSLPDFARMERKDTETVTFPLSGKRIQDRGTDTVANLCDNLDKCAGLML